MNELIVAETQIIKTEVPRFPGDWSLQETIDKLKRPLPSSLLKTKKMGNKDITYIPWYVVNRILDKYCPGWTWEVKEIKTTEKWLFLTGRLTIVTSEGTIYREATGSEKLDCSSYGDPSSNAESMALRRCCARFGLGLYLYDK